MTTSEKKSYYSPKEVASILGVDIYTVRRWLREDTLHGIKIGAGKHWRISYEELQRTLQERIG